MSETRSTTEIAGRYVPPEPRETSALQEEIARLQQALAEMTKERDAYRRVVQAWAIQDVSDADIERYRNAEAGLPLEDFLGELEQLSQRSQP